MLEQRSLKRDAFSVALAAVTILLGVMLCTYNPADPPASLVHPAHDHATNACGRIGALVVHGLLTALGLGAYYLVVSMAVLCAVLLRRQAVSEAYSRAFGWLLSLVGLTSLLMLVAPHWSPGPVIGAGGYLGAAGRTYLEMHFAAAGAGILSLAMIAGGLLLCTDYVLVRLAYKTLLGTGRGVGSAAGLVKKQATRKLRTDLPQTIPAKAAAPEPAIRIGGRRLDEADEEEDEEEDEELVDEQLGEDDDIDDELEEEDEEQDEQPAAGGDSTVRVLNPASKRTERQAMMAALDAASRHGETHHYELPSIELLAESEDINFEAHEKEVRRKAKILEKTFLDFGFNVKVVEIETGPVIAQFEVELEAGLRLSKITGLADDLAIALRVPSVRIVAPIPGKNTVGIEVPNGERQLVRLREVIEEANGKAQKMKIPIYLGKDVAGAPMVCDLASLPHLLIAGRTGTGKSVCLNSIITSMLMTRRPDEVRMLLIDPKMVELSPYKTLPHLMHPVVTDMRKAEAILAWAVEKMEERYSLLARAGVRHIAGYNQLGEEELMERLQPETDEERGAIPMQLPYIVIVADEMADLMMTAAKEVETHIIRLAQKSRAVGIHLVLATQKPTVDVITGLIKSNLPARIAFQVASRTDSRVVLDEMGADKLLGNGDMLFLWPGTSTLIRGQGTYVSDEEIAAITGCVGTTEPEFVHELVALKPTVGAEAAGGEGMKHRDDMYEAAVEVIVREGRGSVSLLQRALGVGYGRGARLIDFMAEDGIVGPYNGSQAREVLITLEQWEQMRGAGGPPEDPKPKKRRTNKIAPSSTPAADYDDEDAEELATADVADELEEEYEEVEEDEAELDEEDDGDEADEDEGEEDEYDEEEYDDDRYAESA